MATVNTVKFEQSRDAQWIKMRELVDFTIPQVANSTNIANRTVSHYVKDLVESGHVICTEKGQTTGGAKRATPDQYRVVKAQHATPCFSHSNSLQQAIWKAFQILQRFTTKEMLQAISTPELDAKQKSITEYLKKLKKGGYLVNHRRGADSVWHWVPSNYSGPRAPQIVNAQVIWDPNLKLTTYNPLQELETEQ